MEVSLQDSVNLMAGVPQTPPEKLNGADLIHSRIALQNEESHRILNPCASLTSLMSLFSFLEAFARLSLAARFFAWRKR